MALSCGSSSPAPVNSNIEPIVTYDRQEELRKNARYINENHLSSILSRGNDVVIIFSADWCKACRLTRDTLTKAKLSINVYYVDVDESWVMQLAGIMSIKTIPIMFHTDKAGKTLAARVGPASIVSYLIKLYR